MNGWFKKGIFWGYLKNGMPHQLCAQTDAGLWVMAPMGDTLRVGFIFKGDIAQYKIKSGLK